MKSRVGVPVHVYYAILCVRNIFSRSDTTENAINFTENVQFAVKIFPSVRSFRNTTQPGEHCKLYC